MYILFNRAVVIILIAATLLLTSCSITKPPLGSSSSSFTLPAGTPLPAETQTKIVLLLPIHGELAATGTAIHNGFLAAYYYDKNQTTSLPAIQVIDSSQGDIQTLYQQAVDQGASFVVGPLLKNNVATIANLTSLPVPTLALNTLNGLTATIPNFYQFGISPIDEALQIAQHAYAHGHRQALVIAPQNEWGQNISNAFIDQWQTLGGKVVGNLAFGAQQTLADDIRNLLKVTQSDQRANDLKKVLKDSIRFIPRHRDDADMIFLVALPAEARSIRPLLKFYYAGNLSLWHLLLLRLIRRVG